MDNLIPDFLILALLGGILTSLLSAPIGTFMLWRRMAYFGDALAHTTLLGLSLGLWLQLPLHLALMVMTLIVALAITWIKQGQQLGIDTFIAIAAHSSFALGIIAMSFLPNTQIDLMGYLFGDLLSLTYEDLIWLTIAALIISFVIFKFWKALLLCTLNTELAQLMGINHQRLEMMLAILIAVVVAISTKLIGALLMTALLITPAAIARRWANTPVSMIFYAIGISISSVMIGLFASWQMDLPASASIVAALFLLFVVSRLLPSHS